MSALENIIGSEDGLITSDCGITLSYIEGNSLSMGYIGIYHNTQWKVRIVSRSNFFVRRNGEQSITTQVQVLLSSIPQERIETTIVQPLDIVTNIIALSNSQQIEGSYRARAMIDWPHAESLDAGDSTYYGLHYIINGTTGEFPSTTDNSTEITLKSEQVDQGLTLIIKNQLGVGNTTFFEPSWPEVFYSFNSAGG